MLVINRRGSDWWRKVLEEGKGMRQEQRGGTRKKKRKKLETELKENRTLEVKRKPRQRPWPCPWNRRQGHLQCTAVGKVWYKCDGEQVNPMVCDMLVNWLGVLYQEEFWVSSEECRPRVYRGDGDSTHANDLPSLKKGTENRWAKFSWTISARKGKHSGMTQDQGWGTVYRRWIWVV